MLPIGTPCYSPGLASRSVYDLRSFSLADVLDCTSTLRHLGEGAQSMEEAAGAVVRFLHEELRDKERNQRALPLVRMYKTHRYDELDPEVRAFADRAAPGEPLRGKPCLTLLATAGDEPVWNDRRKSRDHQAIPLASAAALDQAPMVYQLVRQLGLEPADVLEPNPALYLRTHDRAGGVFYVRDAVASPYVPAQDFVEKWGIRSVIGFGGVLPSGYMFAVVMFASVDIPPTVADAFATLAFAVQLALLPAVGLRVFASDPPRVPEESLRGETLAHARSVALEHLLDARQDFVIEQSLRLEQAVRDAEDRADALARSQLELAKSEATKSAILDSALDGVVTMDARGRIVDFNPAAAETFGYSRDHAQGRRVEDLLVPERLRALHAAGLRRHVETGVSTIIGQRIETSARRADGTEFQVELTVTEVFVDGAPMFCAYVRDITERLRAQTALREAGERYAHIARTLQASLLPPALPPIPGVEVASTYRAAGEGIDVGGDFYDVFEISDSHWGVALGDVMGKGTEAAAVTALARYTLRAAAMRAGSPSAVLKVLNDAINRHDTERFCTVVFGRLRLGSPCHLTLSSGGHPPAILRTGAGASGIDVGGPLIGPFPQWTGSERHIALNPGDTVVLYSDGVTEARRGDELFGIPRLIELLDRTQDLDAAMTVALIEESVLDFADSPSDDLAVVAIRVHPD